MSPSGAINSTHATNAWSLATSGEYHWAQWNDSDEVVLHFTGSGDTYLISYFGYLLLDTLKGSPKTAEQLDRLISSSNRLSDDLLPIPKEMIDSHLFHFKKLGLIEL
ncbi:MAG: hypothetical protein OQL17_06665 [Sedimenticola sp.]|uniref:HPr-rel-A system PqqD family peptide chaperone n=1 Tax=Sedimenticola thiotaurini TaxID=1543721 RepID=A0A558CU11_9GAMM|nr:hypothetical protein [Sedimenticola sp.]MCW8949651.1 hypothetical protein [Sedimenticola sp.]TVT52269.1 MAG: hypothetical protein FHK82_13945 [Sedimenticola thiotaurini]